MAAVHGRETHAFRRAMSRFQKFPKTLSIQGQEVDKLNAAAEHGGTSDINPKQDLGFMYSCAIADLDGHVWEMFWMDSNAIQQ
jgi:predicted lactoylglutathione lyase